MELINATLFFFFFCRMLQSAVRTSFEFSERESGFWQEGRRRPGFAVREGPPGSQAQTCPRPLLLWTGLPPPHPVAQAVSPASCIWVVPWEKCSLERTQMSLPSLI